MIYLNVACTFISIFFLGMSANDHEPGWVAFWLGSLILNALAVGLAV